MFWTQIKAHIGKVMSVIGNWYLRLLRVCSSGLYIP